MNAIILLNFSDNLVRNECDNKKLIYIFILMSLCAYKDLFGKPNTGLHSYRIFNIAIVDLTLTIFAAWLISKLWNYNMFSTLLFLLLSSIIIHKIFCVKTTISNLF